MTKILYRESATKKIVMLPNYNFVFDKTNGNFARWGKTKEDDPQQAPAPEIADIEISTVCTKGCAFCFLPSTLVHTSKNKIPIKDIIIGEHVISYNGTEQINTVEQVFKRHVSEYIYILTLESGETIEVTGNHEFLIGDTWTRADSLHTGDDIIERQK